MVSVRTRQSNTHGPIRNKDLCWKTRTGWFNALRALRSSCRVKWASMRWPTLWNWTKTIGSCYRGTCETIEGGAWLLLNGHLRRPRFLHCIIKKKQLTSYWDYGKIQKPSLLVFFMHHALQTKVLVRVVWESNWLLISGSWVRVPDGAPERASNASCRLFSSCCHCLSQRKWADAGRVSLFSFHIRTTSYACGRI